MDTTHTINCSSCGSAATRRYFTSNEAMYSCCSRGEVIHTECPICDYLMTICSLNGIVIEAHSSSTSIANNVNKSKISTERQKGISSLKKLPA